MKQMDNATIFGMRYTVINKTCSDCLGSSARGLERKAEGDRSKSASLLDEAFLLRNATASSELWANRLTR